MKQLVEARAALAVAKKCSPQPAEANLIMALERICDVLESVPDIERERLSVVKEA